VVRLRVSSISLVIFALAVVSGLSTCSRRPGRSPQLRSPATVSGPASSGATESQRLKEIDKLGESAPKDPGAIPQLGRWLRDPSRAVANHAAEWLAKTPSGATPVLLAALAETAPQTRVVAAYGLGLVGPDASNAIPGLARQLGGADDSVANMADWAISQIQPRGGPYITLLRGLRFGDPFERADAAGQLARYGEGAIEAMPLLLRALQDSDPQVAQNAGAALIAIGPRATPAVEALILSRNPTTRLRAMIVLGRLRPSYF
jgi:HEAT repeat protein